MHLCGCDHLHTWLCVCARCLLVDVFPWLLKKSGSSQCHKFLSLYFSAPLLILDPITSRSRCRAKGIHHLRFVIIFPQTTLFLFDNLDHSNWHGCQALRPTIPKNTHPKFAELLERCWQQDPTQRPDFSEIVEILQRLAKEVLCCPAVIFLTP